MLPSNRLIAAHFWLAFAGFGLALLLGAWQMLVRSPLVGWISGHDFPPFRGRRNEPAYLRLVAEALAVAKAFVAEEEVRPIFLDGTAQRSAKVITFER